jgi:RNA polymerase sigma-70 factor, ECF subfamily
VTDGEDFIRSLYADHGAALRSHARRYCPGEPHRAEDLVQETFLRAWRLRQEEQATVNRTWLMTVLTRLAIDSWRRNRFKTSREAQWETQCRLAQAADHVERFHDRQQVAEVMMRLSPAYRAAVAAIYLADLTYEQAGVLLGIPAGTVKSRCTRALAQLRAQAAAGTLAA